MRIHEDSYEGYYQDCDECRPDAGYDQYYRWVMGAACWTHCGDYYKAATRERMSWVDATSVALCVFMPSKCPRSQQGQKLRTWWRKRFSTTIDRHPRAMARRAKVLATDRMAHGKEAGKRLQWKELRQGRQVEVLCWDPEYEGYPRSRGSLNISYVKKDVLQSATAISQAMLAQATFYRMDSGEDLLGHKWARSSAANNAEDGE